jgi:hypothetical protein
LFALWAAATILFGTVTGLATGKADFFAGGGVFFRDRHKNGDAQAFRLF